MEYAEKALQGAIELATIDFSTIFQNINIDGSIEPYLAHLRALRTEFEKALAILVLNSTPSQISTFAQLNLKKIDLAIEQIGIIENLFSKYQKQINQDFINIEIINEEIRPIQKAHLSELTYIKRLLQTALDNIGGTSVKSNLQSPSNNQNQQEIEKTQNTETLSGYGEFLKMNDMEKIFDVKRLSIIRWEKEGLFKRCSLRNKSVLFKKIEIQRYLQTK
jgi:hypothetical protein